LQQTNRTSTPDAAVQVEATRLGVGRGGRGLDLVWPWGLVALKAVDGLGYLVQDVDDHDVQHPGSAAQGGQFAQLGDLFG